MDRNILKKKRTYGNYFKQKEKKLHALLAEDAILENSALG